MDSARVGVYVQEFVGKTVDGWQVGGYVGAGKSAVVFAVDAPIDGESRKVIKIFDRELIERFGDEAQAERVRREVSLVGKHHPNLVKIFGGGRCKTHNVFYIVMEYVQSPPLSDVLTTLPRAFIWPVLEQLASAAKFLESEGLCHRDIKPSNIGISSDFKHAVLLDLGVLRPFASSDWKPVTDEDQLSFIGTLQYSSPEALFRTEEDSQSGWRALTFYQLGAVLYDMIARTPIFQAFASPFARLVEAVKYEIPNLEAIDVVPELVLLCRNCLLKDPTQRLEFVAWADFAERELNKQPFLDAKERMRRRQALAKQKMTATSLSDALKRREQQQTLGSIQGKLDELVRATCVGNPLLPRASIFSEVQDNSCSVTIRFAVSDEHSLSMPLVIRFRLLLQDTNEALIAIQVAAVQSSTDPTFEDEDFVQLLSGVFEPTLIGQRVEEQLFIIFDSAQRENQGNVAESRWLTGVKKHE